MDEAKAVARLRRGDTGALAPLVRAYQGPAVRLAYLIIRDLSLAVESVCTAFAESYSGLDQLAVGAAFGPWFLGRVAATALQSAARWEGGPATAAPVPDLDVALGEAMTGSTTWAALGALPPNERAALVLHYYPGAPASSAGRPGDGGGGPLLRAALLTQTLQEYAARALPADLDLWPAIRERVRGLPPPRRAPRVSAATRRGRLPILATAIGLAVVIGLALVGLLARGGGSDLSGMRDVPDDLSLPVQLQGPSQLVNGYRVTVAPVSADANRVVISYTVQAPLGEVFTGSVTNLRLVDGQGQEYQPYLLQTIPELVIPAGGTSAPDTLVFDAAGVVSHPALLDLALTVGLQGRTAAVADGTVRPPGGRGTFSFNFQMPFDATRRALAAPQTATAAGVTMTLEQLVVTPSETRLALRYRPPNGGPLIPQWWPVINLEAGSQHVTLSTGGYFREALVYERSVTWALLEEAGAWTLRVEELQREDSPVTRLRGPWIFQFTLPPASSQARVVK